MGANLARNRDDEPLPEVVRPIIEDQKIPTLKASMKTSTSYTILNPQTPSEVVGCLTLEVQGTENKLNRTGVDIVCVIDTSGSMQGEKLELVKKTLSFMLTQLGDNDRVCLVKFTTSAERLCKLTRCTSSGKKRLEAIFSRLTDESSTNMIEGLEYGLLALAGRRMTNPSSALIMLTDGIDDCSSTSLERAKETIEKVIVPNDYTIHTFGYGSDHDSNLLTSISDSKCGGFYYIEKLDSIAEAFANCLGEIISMVADNIQVSLQTQACDVQFAMSKVFSETGDNSFRMSSILNGSKKEAIFVLSVGPGVFEEDEKKIYPVKANVTFRHVPTDQQTSVEATLEVVLRKDDTIPIIKDEDCMVNYYRFKTAEAMKEAALLGDRGNMDGARNLLQECAEEIKVSSLEKNDLAGVLVKDLECVQMNFSSQHEYASSGKHMVSKKARGHWSKRGEEVEAYQNLFQQDMITESKQYFGKHS
ncbi:hypothetical protein SteCoe_25658 [Stentor coeruleus]|uniref:VWFA domain-containing protein n=1 Tax=Stentor coeruleus TaxID=5963 RepID=A0A1R2BES3_9CILI|nr:hypothetical protein SteCoe_25658 [Stentor coeruleus]